MNEQANPINRRCLLSGALATAAALSMRKDWAAEPAAENPRNDEAIGLQEKFFGCIAGCHIGSAMGAAVEGWPYDRIEREHGLLDRPLPYVHYGNKDWVREPGTTEDGVERQKLMITAIIEKQDRINAEDLRRAWVDHMNPRAAGLISEPFEGKLLAIARSHIPATDIGKYCDYSGLVSLARSCHPIGLINAGDIRAAIDDIREVGQVYNTANSRGILWAEVTAMAIAAATRPKASVDSVIGSVLDHCDQVDPRFFQPAGIRGELERALKLTSECSDIRDLRRRFDPIYSGTGIPYAQSYANEIVTKAICVFRMTQGVTWEAIKCGINMGRDTDCLAAVAAGIAGALSGAGSIPPEIIRQVDYATSVNPHTSSPRTLRENADGLYRAFQARLAHMKAYLGQMDTA